MTINITDDITRMGEQLANLQDKHGYSCTYCYQTGSILIRHKNRHIATIANVDISSKKEHHRWRQKALKKIHQHLKEQT